MICNKTVSRELDGTPCFAGHTYRQYALQEHIGPDTNSETRGPADDDE